MVKSTYTTVVLTASPDHYLTQAHCEDITTAILTDKLYLAATDSADNYREITAAEADDIRRQQAELIAQREREMEQEQQPQGDGLAD